jgi:hypothetical protein
MVDTLSGETNKRPRISSVILPALVLGMTTSIRVLGPLAGLLVLGYAIWKFRNHPGGLIRPFAMYGMIAVLTMFATWPFLWENPLENFINVFRLMSDNPTTLSVLFGGEVYRAGELPRRYMPLMLVTTLTEPVWPLFIIGLFFGYYRLFRAQRHLTRGLQESASADRWMSLRSSLNISDIRNHIVSLTLTLSWFLILLAYVLLRRPAMYDGLRHFLFILPPIFIFTGFAFEFMGRYLINSWLYAGLVLLLLMPGITGIVKLHPYEYTYYNSLVGGTSGAFREYETDYWLTCYKEAVERLEQTPGTRITLYVHREAYIADYYAGQDIAVHELRGALDQVRPGDTVLVNTRTNEDRRVFEDAPSFLDVGRGDAVFCEIKQIP